MLDDQPKWRTGKLCYIEIPAVDVARSAEFYHQAFGWNLRQRGDGATAARSCTLAGPDDGEVFAWFADPAGNTLGIYQQPGLAETEAKAEADAEAEAEAQHG